ncbi:MAG TPA: zinc-dependent alcohol dehydrogenase [Deltaproteobacteria bacterium]|jgi:S-(hydroxymethyl)glutathione dehydrogenase/alcohol dehydrogenase|nr:zinc-dependent alcohol dehydrogenase [Deltaproteobacteria bacterium]HOI07538.1 zinc-dependent alcohol dehydrogenase [Deltaproteobacteria bacterium]
MKAVVYHGPYDVRVDNTPMPEIMDPEDAIVRVTTTAICGSDLHLYHGSVPGMEPGLTLGHEFMGIVEEVGPEVHEIARGDRVVLPFNVSCGKCWYCRRGLWSQCDRSNANAPVGAAFGYGQALGGYDGGQAEYVRVPYANTDPLKIPEGLEDNEVIFLSDILPTGYFGVDIARVSPGDDVAVFGAGPVGYFAVVSAFIRGAAMVLSIDNHEARLEKTRRLGARTINFDEEDPVEAIMEATRGQGAVCVDAVGYEAQGHHASPDVVNPAYPNENPIQVIQWISQAGRKFSTVGVPGVYLGSYNAFPFGDLFNREIQIHMGQCPVKRYNEPLLHLIETGRIRPSELITNEMKLGEAPEAYDIFSRREDGVVKIVLKP